MRMLSALAIIIIIAYGGLCVFLYVFQGRFVYFPAAELAATPADIGLQYEDITLTTRDGTGVHGWFVPADRARGVVLFLHGNAGNISHRLESLETLHELHLSTFIIDYHGYGQSGGKPSEQGTYMDAEAAWDYLTGERGIPAREIIVFGRSLGGAVASWLVARHTPGAAIIESTFTSMPDIAAHTYPLLPARWLAHYKYPVLENLRRAQCPVLIVHSPDDALIPIQHGRRLYEVVPGEKAFLEIAGTHNNGFVATGEDYAQGIDEFLQQTLAHQAPNS